MKVIVLIILFNDKFTWWFNTASGSILKRLEKYNFPLAFNYYISTSPEAREQCSGFPTFSSHSEFSLTTLYLENYKSKALRNFSDINRVLSHM